MESFSLFHFLMLIPFIAAVYGEVLDTHGDALIPGFPYYVMPADSTVGGLGLNRFYSNCPLDVVQFIDTGCWGIPVRFHPLVPGLKIVPESDNLYVDFNIPIIPICRMTSVWKVDNSTSQGIVKTGGNRTERTSWFRIEKTESGTAYKIVYSPTDKMLCKPFCVDVGFRYAPRARRLTVGGHKLEVVFVKSLDKRSVVAADQ